MNIKFNKAYTLTEDISHQGNRLKKGSVFKITDESRSSYIVSSKFWEYGMPSWWVPKSLLYGKIIGMVVDSASIYDEVKTNA